MMVFLGEGVSGFEPFVYALFEPDRFFQVQGSLAGDFTDRT